MTKFEGFICDQCGKRDRTMRLEVYAEVYAFGDQSEMDFCSWECLALYAKEKAMGR